MARVRFLKDFDYRPPVFGVTIAYKAGETYTVKRDCADQAIAVKAAVTVRAPRPAPKAGGDD